MRHVNIFVRGRVQGVFYRANTRRMAQLYNIKGFVRNEPDGSVYIEAEGEESNLQNFIQWCKQGPEMAFVESIDVQEGEIKDFKRFEIKY